MTKVQINSGGPDIADGSYPMQLMKVSGPRHFIPDNGANAGKDVYVFDWIWRTTNHKGIPLELEETSSTATGPRSKLFEWVTALQNGIAPEINQELDLDELVGRWALGQIQRDPPGVGWPKITQMMALPPQMQQALFAQATGAPAQPTPAPASVQATPQAVPVGAAAAPGDPGLFGVAGAQPVAPTRPVDDLPF